MTRICMIITKRPHSDESVDSMYGLAQSAKDKGMDVAVYLLGDGVLCAKKGQSGKLGKEVRTVLEKGVAVKASKRDLFARALTEEYVESGIEIVDDFEGLLVNDIMENADRVVSW